ncbi:MarR family winged helix-turn-helix transcriptional regulator [Latilactobacillus fragifolii]|uniref:MarR family winged helix-turn-helix transcriptional regulator n=1 Tax=Latilactobacillus fragifolii TaxID=2814244 RepID=UPI001ABAE574|nr:MarR family transcriptional regulator [Latilactobacillus fragifolii]
MPDKRKILLISEWYLECQNITNQLNKLSEEHGLSYDQFLVLEQIVELTRNTPGQIAAVFGTSAPAASRKINTLQSKKFIRKIRDMEHDQRTVWLEATEEGLRKYEALKKAITKHTGIKATDLAYLRQINQTILE